VNRNFCLSLAILAGSLAATTAVWGQPRAIAAADYARAEKFMNYNTSGLLFRASVQPNWLSNDRMWYRVTTAEGSEFILVDAARGTRETHSFLSSSPAALVNGALWLFGPKWPE
jgi:hypothetical protein